MDGRRYRRDPLEWAVNRGEEDTDRRPGQTKFRDQVGSRCVPFSILESVVLHFAETGERSPEVEWEEV